MSSDQAIRARGVTKRYRIRTDRTDAPGGGRPKREWFTALDSVDFDVDRGEVVGLIGPNGSGKSTLLKVLCRITAPSSGEIDVWGRVGSLLEVGTGFHQELTGRENVYLNGSILGMTRPEIERHFADIVEFADIGPFLDTPVKRYSSGMRVRLAFAVAAHLNPEILLVDEVLAVGDAEFQRRCLGKMNDVALNEGRTVVFVSHNMPSIEHLCSRVVVLDSGMVSYVGEPEEAIARYLASGAHGGSHDGPGVFVVDGNHVTRITTTDGQRPVDTLLTGQPLGVVIDVKNFGDVRVPLVGISVWTPNDQLVFSANTHMRPMSWSDRSEDGAERIELLIPELPLAPGHYWLKVHIRDLVDNSERDRIARVAELDVVGGANMFGSGYQPHHVDGLIYVHHDWSLRTREREKR